MSRGQGRLCTFVIQMPHHQDDVEPTTHISDRRDLRDILLGINPEWQKMKGGGANTGSSLGHMATPERQAVQWQGGVHRWGRICCIGFCGRLVLSINGQWWPIMIEIQSCGSVTDSSSDRPLLVKKEEAIIYFLTVLLELNSEYFHFKLAFVLLCYSLALSWN